MSVNKTKNQNKWRLFRASDFLSLMEPCFFFCRLHGLFPYTINCRDISYSKSKHIYSTILTAFFMIYIFVVLFQMDVYGNVGMGTFNVPRMLQNNCYLLFGGFVMIFTYVFSIPRMYFLKKIMMISSNIPVESFKKISVFLHGKDLLGFTFLFIHAFNACCFEIHKSLRALTYLYITILVFLVDMQYINFVSLIKICFKTIHEELKDLKNTMIMEEPHLLRRIYHEQHNILILTKFRKLQKQHYQVSDVLKKLNSNFGLHVVATVTMTFSEITFSLYFYILTLFDGNKYTNTQEQIWDFNLLITMTFYLLKLILIVWTCEKAKKQAQKIGSSVHDVLLNTFDATIKEEVTLSVCFLQSFTKRKLLQILQILDIVFLRTYILL